MLDSVQSKNLEISGDNLSDGVVSVNNSEGEIRFSARITEIGNYEVSAELEFDFNNETWKQLIGKSSVECPDVTIVAPENVNEFSAEIYGLASKGEEVTIYVNDAAVGTFTANSKTGKYKGNVTLPESSDGSEYILRAECGDAVSHETTIVYSSVKPVVEKVVMEYNSDSEMDITDVLKQGITPVISYNPASSLTFKITATHGEKIYRMFVTSTKGSATKYIEAFYDPDKDVWIASGYFDPENHSYVPGKLNVSIFEDENIVISDENYDDTADMVLDELPEEYVSNSSVEILEQSENAVLANMKMSDGVTANEFMYYSAQADGTYIGSEFVSAVDIAKAPESYGFTKANVVSEADGKTYAYYIRTDAGREIADQIAKQFKETSSKLKDDWRGTTVLKFVEGDYYDTQFCKIFNNYAQKGIKSVFNNATEGMYGDIGKILSVTSDTSKFIYRLSQTQGNEALTAAAYALFACKMFNTFGGTDMVLTMCGAVPPVSTVLKWAIGKGLSFAENYLDECISNNQQFSFSGFIKFIIDPSGIVYEAVIGNPVEDATVTVYYKDSETGESVKWDASDYDQLNPILTDKDGKYLWDVPEGQWKVICEKEGYETVETEWMDIPPVRTDVNLALVSKEAPVLESANINNEEIVVKFSKFVDISTVTSDDLVLTDFEGAYKITPQLINEGDKYADTFILTGDFTANVNSITVTDGVTSYAGISAKNGEINVTDSRISMGDVNGDGTVNLKDAVMIRRYIAGNWDIDINEAVADVNGDGTVNLKDVVMIRRYIAGNWDVSFDSAA